MYFFDLYQQIMKKSVADVAPFTAAATWPEEWKTIKRKVYERFPLHPLPPTPSLTGDLSTALTNRHSGRTFGHTITEAYLSQLLFYTLGETQSGTEKFRRPYASAGGLYPLEGYLLLTKPIGTIAPGVYHYDVVSHGLRTLLTTPPTPQQLVAATAENYVVNATGALILTSCMDRIAPKYAERAYKFTLLEAGAVLQNFALVAAALKLHAVQVGTFAEDVLEPLLGIDGSHEVYVQTMWFG